MIDKYQIYMLYKTVKKMWNAKRFNTAVFNDFFDNTLEEYLISQYIHESPRVEYMANYGIKLVNEINCGLIDVEHWLMYVMMKCLCDKKCPEMPEINSINKLKDNMIFKKRPIIDSQIKLIQSLIAEKGSGLNEFMDTRFSLYDLDANQENQAYKMYSMSQLDPEFYIQGFKAGKFKIDMDKIKSIDYKRFIMFTKMILKLNQEISDKNVNR